MVLRLATLLCAALATLPAAAQPGRSYPLVYGHTGRPYGPTQANYQYQLQYGRPWPGTGVHGGGSQVGHYGGGWGGGGGYGPGYGGGPFVAPFVSIDPYAYAQGYNFAPSTAYFGYSYSPGLLGPYYQPIISVPTPPVMTPLGVPPQPGINWAPQDPHPGQTDPIVEPSTPQALQKSLHLQARGDQQMQQLSFLAASQSYRDAIDAARDRPEPRYRLALTLAARSRFLEAVDQLKLAVALDASWPQRAESLDTLFGSRNTFEKTRVKTRVAEWTAQDTRDPNRLFLLGVLLAQDGDPQNARQLLDTAVLLAGPQEHLTAFLAPRVSSGPPPAAAPAPQPAAPPEQPALPMEQAPAEQGQIDPTQVPQRPVPEPPIPGIEPGGPAADTETPAEPPKSIPVPSPFPERGESVPLLPPAPQ